MKAGLQTKGLSFWDHGVMVHEYYKDLFGERKHEWKLPSWFTTNEAFIRDKLPRADIMSRYHVWHDCGKPYARIVDADGKVHFPDHADISADLWLACGGEQEIADLIRDDMRCHLLRPADALEFSKHPNALALLVTALCELHANASMFGGLESDSFKIKYKRLDKCGNIVLSALTKD